LDVEAADGAQVPAAREARDVERHRQRAQRLSNRQRLRLKAETLFLRQRRQPRLWSTTIRNCWFTPFRIEDVSNGER
jgi:hypothetical protein